jgi:probable HAF family extracellular repeat protein
MTINAVTYIQKQLFQIWVAPPGPGLVARLVAAALIALTLVLGGPGVPAYADSITDLGNLGGLDMSPPAAISGNGMVVVGNSNNAALDFLPYYWTAADGMDEVGDFGGGFGDALAVNYDGSVIVGFSTNPGPTGNDQAFRWENGVMAPLASLVPNADSMAEGVSSDGSVIVGYSVNGAGNEEACRWEVGVANPLGLGTILGRTDSDAFGISADGKVIVGEVSNAGLNTMAFRWEAGVMNPLGTLGTLPGLQSYANAVNADGSVVVGSAENNDGDLMPFRWTQAGGMISLGSLGGDSQANALSADGSVVVGVSQDSNGVDYGFVWTDMGMVSIDDMLISAGVDMSSYHVSEATGISADGSTIVAIGVKPTTIFAGFLIRANGITTASALSDSLAELSAVASDISYMAMGTMRGLMDQADHLPEPGTARLWLVGSLLGDTSVPGDDMGGEGGFGISLPLSDGLVLGTGVFMGRRDVDLKYGGSQISSMFGPGAFLSYAPDPYGWRAKIGALYERASLDLDRGYPNGAGSSVSKGSTDGHVFSLSGHLGYIHPLTPVLAVQPYVEYDLQATVLDAYTETDSPFPAHFDERKDVMNKARLGAELRYSASQTLDLWGWGAWSHRFDKKGPSMDGYLIGLTDFSYGGGTIDHDWAEVGGGVKYRPSERTEMFSRVTFALENDHYAAPDVALNTGVSWSF